METIIGQLVGLFLFFMIFTPLERFYSLHPEQRIFREGWRTDVIHFLFNRFFVDAASFVVVVALAIFWRWIINSEFQARVAAQPFLLQFFEALLLVDFLGYFYHRWAHSSPTLWKFHSVHHSPKQMDWLAGVRSHPFDQVFSLAFIFVPVYALGFSEKTFGAFLIVFALQGIFLHSNVRFRFRRLRWLIATPEFHHWHHSNDYEARNKNFAGQFPWLDWVFGTLYMPKNKIPQSYGIDENMPKGYLKQLKYPFQKN